MSIKTDWVGWIVPTLRVGTPQRTLCVLPVGEEIDAERLKPGSRAERGGHQFPQGGLAASFAA